MSKLQRKVFRLGLGLGLLVALGTGSCGDNGSNNNNNMTPTDNPPVTMPAIGDGNAPTEAFDHDGTLNAAGDVFKDGRQVSIAEGEKLHACGKLQVGTLRNILSSRGVNLGTMTANSAGLLLASGANVLGVANYPQRVPESDRNTTGGLVRLYDIIIAAVEEVLPDATTDRLGSVANSPCAGAKLFNADNSCNADGIACFIGVPPTAGQIALCNSMVQNPDVPFEANNILVRKRLAVSALAAPVFLCD
ncbi:MAG: hypothetical protein U1A78_24720 [Polyangia bacterium]